MAHDTARCMAHALCSMCGWSLMCTHHRLSVTILATHGKIQSKGVAIDDIHVAGFGSSQSIDSPTEGFVGVDVDDDSGVFTMNRD